MSEWQADLEETREAKDRFLREHPRSPIPEDVREEFTGLSYFPPDPDYRFEVRLDEFDERDRLVVDTSTGGEREYLRWGEFHFEVGDTACRLTAYRADPDEEGLWVPFRDETNGDETYGAGRYVDLEPSDHTGDGAWVLDFNTAYNPYCAYSEAYECPLVPFENHLDVRIEAGERTPEF